MTWHLQVLQKSRIWCRTWVFRCQWSSRVSSPKKPVVGNGVFPFFCVFQGVEFGPKNKPGSLVGRFSWDMIANSPKKIGSISFTSVLLVRFFLFFSRVWRYLTREKNGAKISNPSRIKSCQALPSLKLTVCTWKLMVGRRFFPLWGKRPIFRDELLVLGILTLACQFVAR